MARQIASKLWWDSKNHRWSIKYRGRSYSVSCRQLAERESGIGDSKTASAAAARRWWEEKRNDVDRERLSQQGIQAAIAHANAQVFRNRRIGNEPHALFWSRFGETLQTMAENPKLAPCDFAFDPESGRFDGDIVAAPSPVVIHAVSRLLTLSNDDKADAAKFASKHGLPVRADPPRNPAPPEPGTISELVTSYLRVRRADVNRGALSVGQLGLIDRCLKHFQEHVGGYTPAKEIDEQTVADYRQHVLSERRKLKSDKKRKPSKKENAKAGAPWSASFMRKYCVIAKQFIRWLYELRHLDELPRNLNSLTVKVPAAKVESFALDEIKSLLGAADDQLRLFILLALNTGMTQKDISDLRPDEVDLESGRINRKRSKTKDCENVPVVSYLLWDRTKKLLQTVPRKSNDEHFFLNRSGRPLLHEYLADDGHDIKSDAIKCDWYRLTRVVKLREGLSFKHLRKTSSSLLDAEYGESLAQYFLGHSSRSVAGRHYLDRQRAEHQRKFDSAIAWLGKALGVIADDPATESGT